jgi:hypothetical protein
MDIVTVVVGALICLYGLYTLVMRIKSPEKFVKLKAMKEKFGNSAGNIIHIIAYTVAPIVFGAIVIVSGLNGLSILDIIKS